MQSDAGPPPLRVPTSRSPLMVTECKDVQVGAPARTLTHARSVRALHPRCRYFLPSCCARRDAPVAEMSAQRGAGKKGGFDQWSPSLQTPPPTQPPTLDGHAARARRGPLITYCFASLMKLNYWTPSAGFAPELQKIMAPTSSTSLCSPPHFPPPPTTTSTG